jgi:diguanylate cyclase (GGDEF)-like protein
MLGPDGGESLGARHDRSQRDVALTQPTVEAPDEDAGTRRARVRSRRTLLSALVLNALLFMVCVFLGHRQFISSWAKVGLWALFAWSTVVTAYAVCTYLSVRKYRPTAAPTATMVDSLTGLPDRRGLLAALEGYDATAEEFGRRVRLVDVDLLNLNKVNYEFGQMIGDVVLQDVADLLRRTAPKDNLVGRLGGDEFLIVMPRATATEAEELGQKLGKTIEEYRLSLGERGEVCGIKAKISVAVYLPDQASLHETVVSAKEATAHGKLPEATGEEPTYYHVPRVTLGAFAFHRWQNLDKKMQGDFKQWQREPNEALTQRMMNDIVQMLDEKAEGHWVDFVTAPPGGAGRRRHPTRDLAEAVAKHLGVPYREVMRADSSGPETRSIEPAVDAVIDRGDGVLLVADVISSGILERRCVKKLSAAGAHVQVVAWSAY